MMQSYDLRTPYRPDDITIDNSQTSVEEVVEAIGRRAGLVAGSDHTVDRRHD